MKRSPKNYNVNFKLNDEARPRTEGFGAISPGQAFQKCMEKYPNAGLLQAWREGGYKDGWGITTYEPPSTAQVVEARPAPVAEQLKFNF